MILDLENKDLLVFFFDIILLEYLFIYAIMLIEYKKVFGMYPLGKQFEVDYTKATSDKKAVVQGNNYRISIIICV